MLHPQEYEPICRAVVEDILALRAAMPEGGDPTDLLYLPFDASLVPLRMALNLGDLGGAHDIHRLGLAPVLAHRTQATISHPWPVRPLMAAGFGTLLAGRLAQGMTSFEAYEAALQSIRAPSAEVTQAIREVAPGLVLIDRLEATDLDSENIFNWGSSAFFQ